jgi:hypothetical protein
MRVYPEQEKAQTKSDGETIYGIRQQAMSYIPNKEGKITIPAITVDWWNTAKGKQETFTLEERVVEVVAGAVGHEQQSRVDGGVVSNEESVGGSDEERAEGVSGSSKSLNDYVLWFFVVMILVSLFAYLISLAIKKWKFVRQNRSVSFSPALEKVSSRQLMNQLHQACQQNDKSLAAKSLLSLAQNVWAEDPPINLGALALLVERGSDEIRELDKSLYADVTQDWQGTQLWGAFKEGLKPREKRKVIEQGVLSGSLYPERL